MTVARVRVDADTTNDRPVLVALALSNPNDYTVSTTRVELKLALDDQPIGRLDQDSSFIATPRGTSTMALPLIPDRTATRARLETFYSGRPPVQHRRQGHVHDAGREAEGPLRPERGAGVRAATFAAIRSTRSRWVTVRVIAPKSSSTFPRKMNGP